MSRNASGTYSLPAGNPVVTNTVINSSWANTTMDDIATALTDSLSRSGMGGMTASLKLADGTVGAPGLSFSNETTSGLYRNAANDFRWSIGGTDVLRLNPNLFGLSGTAPEIRITETDAAANNKVWDFVVSGEQLLGRVGSDALAFVSWLAVDRTANAIDAIQLTATATTITGNATITGTATLATANITTANITTANISGSALVQGSSLELESTSPTLLFDETDGAADNRLWRIRANSERLFFSAVNDAQSVSTDFLIIDRTGTTVDGVTLSSSLTTVTGPTVFSQSSTSSPPILLSSANPLLGINETDGAANNRRYYIAALSEQFRMGLHDDTPSLAQDFLTVDRTGQTVDSIVLTTALLQAQGIHNGTAPSGTNNYIASGTYTPTLTNGANVQASTSAVSQWMRVGNVVTVSGVISIDTTSGSSTFTSLGISLPIASNFTAINQCGGVGARANTTPANYEPCLIQADTTNDRAQLDFNCASNDTNNRSTSFHFTYVVV